MPLEFPDRPIIPRKDAIFTDATPLPGETRPWQDGVEVYEPFFDIVVIDGKKFPRLAGYRWQTYTRAQLDEMKRFAEGLMPAPWKALDEKG